MAKRDSSARSRILTGVLVITVGLFGAELLAIRDPSVQALITSRSRTRASARTSSAPAVRSKVSPRTLRANSQTSSLAARSLSSAVYEKSRCGDSLILLDEQCDDGNAASGDGCSSACKTETGYACTGSQPSKCVSRCGDGAIAADERCDDANTVNGDGCSSICRIDMGYTCEGKTSTCYVTPYCGNTSVEHGETCDDGNTTSGDGCSSACKTE